jgi:hypothetical protein
MKQPPRGAKFEKQTMPKCEYLQHALNRLNDEVGTYFQMLEEHNKKSARKVGFWSSIRIIMPIIEAISHILGEKPQDFLGKHLDVKTPYLVWDLFRHSLIHGDYIQHAKYGNKDIGWGVALIGVGHVIQSQHIGIDPIYLYKKLKEYLNQEIAKNDQSNIEFETGVIYLTPIKEIVNDFKKLA